ncbi:hypothetical protein D3C87_1543890 [compost metagenome]
MIPGPHLAHHRIGDRRHAGGKAAGRLGAFDQRHAVLEHVVIGVGEARVIVPALHLALEQQLGMFGAGIGVAGIEEQGLAGFVELGPLAPAMHHLGRSRELLGVSEGIVLPGHRLRLQTRKPARLGGRFQNGL